MALEQELHLDQPFKDLRHEAVLNVIHTATFLSTLGSTLFRKHGLTVAQFNVLFALKYKIGDITQSALSQRLVVTRASMTSVLDKLEQKGLVERKAVPKNRRIYHVSLTPAGRKLINAIEPSYREDLHAVMAGLRDEDCRTLIRLLERVRLHAPRTIKKEPSK